MLTSDLVRPRERSACVQRPASRRRRGRALSALGLLLVWTAPAACTEPSDDAATPPSRIQVGDCFVDGSIKSVDCDEHHVAQTVYVSNRPPADAATGLAPCRQAQAKFLGQDFNTRFDVQLWVPDDKSWYRCDVLLRNSTQGRAGYQVLTGSLEGVLSKGVSVKLQACLGEPYDATTDQPYASCGKPHVSQELFVAPAIGTQEEDFPGDVTQRATQACNATASAASQIKRGRSVAAYYPENSSAWSTGERSADCWVTAERGQLPPVEPDRK